MRNMPDTFLPVAVLNLWNKCLALGGTAFKMTGPVDRITRSKNSSGLEDSVRDPEGELEPLHDDCCNAVIVDANGSSKHDTEKSVSLDIVFQDICADIKGKYILSGVSGECRPGEILAILGPSGAGKSTLLNAISGRHFSVTGTVMLGGKRFSRRLRHHIGYATQREVFHCNLTLRQTLLYTAQLTLSRNMSYGQMEAAVNSIILEMGLQECQNTLFKTDGGLSGGERKRASIAYELITDPPVLLLDEPTSGLDSNTALKLMNELKVLAKNRSKSIVITIHQPSSQIFSLLDKVLLLSEGEVYYYGQASQVVANISRLEFITPANYNPADLLLEIVSCENGKKILKDQMTRFSRNSNYKTSGLQENNNNGSLINDLLNDKGTNSFDSDLYFEKEHEDSQRWHASVLTQVKVLSNRSFVVAWPNLTSKFVWIQTVVMAIMAGLLWFALPYNEVNIHDIQGWMYFSTTYWMLHSHFNALNIFPREKDVFIKERQGSLYRISTYYISKSLSETPTCLAFPFVYFLISYSMLGVYSAKVTGIHLSMLLLNSMVAQSFGKVVSVACMDSAKCVSVSALLTLFMQLFGGYLSTSIPTWMQWTKYISMIRYAYNNMNIVQFCYGAPIRCAPENSRFVSCSNGAETVDPMEILEEAGATLPLWFNTCGLLLMFIVMNITGYVILRFRYRPKL